MLFFLLSCTSEVDFQMNQVDSSSANNQPLSSDWNDFDLNIVMGIEDTGGGNYVFEFEFNNLSSLASALTEINSSTISVNGNIRGMTMTNDGEILIGATGDTIIPLIDKNLTLIRNLSPSGAYDEATTVHALCSLPNGNYIVAEGSSSTGNIVNEFDKNDQFVREVYSTVKSDHGSITDCVGIDDETIIWVESGTWAFTSSNLMRMKLVNDNWISDQVLDSETFDPGNGTNFWNLTKHSDGHIYFTPSLRDGSRFNQLLRCPIDDISVSECTPVGDAIPDGSSGDYLSWVRGIVQIPGSNNMLVVTSQKIYFYNYNSGAYTEIYDLTSSLINIYVVRTVKLAPKSY